VQVELVPTGTATSKIIEQAALSAIVFQDESAECFGTLPIGRVAQHDHDPLNRLNAIRLAT
jgi:hypothetical protein